MIKIIDINFLNEKAAIGCFLIKDNDDLVLIETGPSIYYCLLYTSDAADDP